MGGQKLTFQVQNRVLFLRQIKSFHVVLYLNVNKVIKILVIIRLLNKCGKFCLEMPFELQRSLIYHDTGPPALPHIQSFLSQDQTNDH